MATLKMIHTNEAEFTNVWKGLLGKVSLVSQLLDNKDRLSAVQSIVERVRVDGDKAIAQMTKDFDGVDLEPKAFRVPDIELKAAHVMHYVYECV